MNDEKFFGGKSLIGEKTSFLTPKMVYKNVQHVDQPVFFSFKNEVENN